MLSQIIIECIALVLLGIIGPILCFVVVYGLFDVLKILNIKIKSMRFKRRMRIANEKKKDEFEDIDEDIEVEVITSIDREMEDNHG